LLFIGVVLLPGSSEVYLKKDLFVFFFPFCCLITMAEKLNIFLIFTVHKAKKIFIVVSSRVSGLEAFSHNLPNRW